MQDPYQRPTVNDLQRWVRQLHRFGQTLWGYIVSGGAVSWSPTELSLVLPTAGLLFIPTWILHGFDYFVRGLQSVANLGVISRADDLFSVVNYFDYDFFLPPETIRAFPAASNLSNAKLRVLAMCAKLAYEEWFYSYVAQDIVASWQANTLAANLGPTAGVKWVEGFEFEQIRYLDAHGVATEQDLGTEACILAFGDPIAAVVIAFRGSEPFIQADWFTDFEFTDPVDAPIGRTHPGFRIALGLDPTLLHALPNCRLTWVACPASGAGVRRIWDNTTPYQTIVERLQRMQAEENFVDTGAKLYTTGHSLGGALALMLAASLRYRAALRPMDPEAGLGLGDDSPVQGGNQLRFGCTVTFGQPRVGDRKFRQLLNRYLQVSTPAGKELCYYRVTNTIDIVPRVPPPVVHQMEYAHAGQLLLYNALGNLQSPPSHAEPPHIYWWTTWIMGVTKLAIGWLRFIWGSLLLLLNSVCKAVPGLHGFYFPNPWPEENYLRLLSRMVVLLPTALPLLPFLLLLPVPLVVLALLSGAWGVGLSDHFVTDYYQLFLP
uniref:Lipid body protein n=1 Tax=Lobosphaera incisa TaxID=312850 RepID=A0A1X9QDS1_9CHLO|nr:lipid body protein [Lobosphaera incisa]